MYTDFECIMKVKGILHSNMKILLSFTHPHVLLNLYEFFQQNTHTHTHTHKHLDPIDFHCMDEIFWIAIHRRKKVMQVWNDMMVSK